MFKRTHVVKQTLLESQVCGIWLYFLVWCHVECLLGLIMLITATQTEAVTLSLPVSHLSSLKTSWVMLRPTAALVKVCVVLC